MKLSTRMFAVMDVRHCGDTDLIVCHASTCKRMRVLSRTLVGPRQVDARDVSALSVIMWVVGEQMEDRECDKFYRASMLVLEKASIPFLVGGAYAFGIYTGISRDTKDFDLFVQPK